MGITAHHHVWGGDAHLLQEFPPAPRRRLLPQSLMQEQRLTELIRNGEHRIERRQRLLKNHGDAVAPDGLQRRFLSLQEVDAFKADTPRRVVTAGWLDETHKRQRRDRFPTRRLPYQRQTLPLFQRKGDPVYRPR